MGMGGVTIPQLEARLSLLRRYQQHGAHAESVRAVSAVVDHSAHLGTAVTILDGAIIHAGAVVGDGVIVNTRAVLEHNSAVGDGTHLAPGALVLGRARVGACCLIGAGAVVLPDAIVPDQTTIPALRRYPS